MGTPSPNSPVQAKEGLNYWSERWEENRTAWHLDQVNPDLVKFMYTLTGTSSCTIPRPGEGLSIFVPLCGKSKDLAYLHSLGFRVFAIEGARQPLLELDQEDGLGLQFNETESTYSTADGMLVIYCGDFFQCPVERCGPFDCVWDRSSFIAVEYAARRPYIEVMKRSLRSGGGKYATFRYLLDTVNYDRSLFDGPPLAVDARDMEQFFGDWTQYEALSTELNPETKFESMDVETSVYLLKPKSS